MSKLAMVLDILSDGEWHGIDELQQRLELDEREVRVIAAFLSKYDFAKSDEENRKVRINRDFQKLLSQTVT
jgi:DNA-binding IclR family transcriptional regulator